MRINTLAPGALPFTQTAAGSVPPVSARVILVSSLTQPLPVATGVPSSAVFDSIWAAGENAVPAGWGTYNGTGEELRIRRINLGPLFHRLMLIDRDSDTVDPGYQPPLFSIDSPDTFEVASGAAGHDALYLDGTVVGLHSAGGALHTRYVQKRDISFVFERGLWRGWIGPGNPTFDASDEFVAEAVAFLGSDWNANARRGASQTGVLVTMYVFMFDYALWAEECPNFSTHGAPGGANVQNVPEYAVLDSLGKNQAGGILYGASLDLLDR
jgi:hypothetical protein